MRVHIDEARGEHPSVSLRNLPGAVLREFPDRANEAAFDGDIGWVRLAAAAVQHAHISDKAVTTRHRAPFLFRYTPSFSAGEKSV